MLTPTNTEMAARLKAEGNALFQAKDYAGAYDKYTQAISYDDKNAILYCNRSACSLNLRRRLDAAEDADVATQLDPTYAKAWSRLGAARAGSLNTLNTAIYAFRKALSALPPQSASSPAIERQRTEYAALLKAAEESEETMQEDAMIRASPLHELAGIPDFQMPWNLAAALIPTLRSSGQWNSSAWLIQYARQEWDEGIRILKELKVWSGPGEHQRSAMGNQGCVMHLSNALLADPRVVKVMRDPDVHSIAQLPDQLRLELSTNGGWNSGGSRKVIAEASQQLRTGDVEAIREALSLTVRAWIISGWLEDYIAGAIEHSLDYFTNALEVLQWGMELWKDEDLQVPGLAFQPAVVRAVKCFHLRGLMKAFRVAKTSEEITQILEEVGAGANDLIEELEEEREEPLGEWETPLFLGFVRYQLAEAHALRGAYFHHTAKKATRAAGGFTEDIEDLYAISADAYIESARIYPQDDEHHFWSLWFAYNILLDMSHPVGNLVDIMERALNSAEKMKTVWDVALHTPVSERKDALESCVSWRADLMSNLEQGTITRDAPIRRPLPPDLLTP